MREKTLTLLAFLLFLAAGAVMMAPRAEAMPPCTQVYDPVICENGEIYGSLCYANRAGAVGCVPYQPEEGK